MVWIRTATIEDAAVIARVHVTSWRSTYRGIVPDAVLEQLSTEERATDWEQWIPSGVQVLVAGHENELVGFISGGRNREPVGDVTAELYAMYLLGAVQRQGIGTALLRALSRRLAAEGHRSMVVWVLADNPSRRFYEAMGAVETARKEIVIGGAVLYEIGYVWRDLEALCEALGTV